MKWKAKIVDTEPWTKEEREARDLAMHHLHKAASAISSCSTYGAYGKWGIADLLADIRNLIDAEAEREYRVGLEERYA